MVERGFPYVKVHKVFLYSFKINTDNEITWALLVNSETCRGNGYYIEYKFVRCKSAIEEVEKWILAWLTSGRVT